MNRVTVQAQRTGVSRTTLLLASTAIVVGLAASPALAQQQQQGGQQGADQTLTQEQAAQQGAPLFVSPADVRQIQQALNNAGYEAGNVDGQIGDGTRNALCNYQQAQGLEPTGALNPQTIQALGLGGVLSGQAGGQQQQGADQTLAQEQAQQQGAPLFVSPATVRQIEQALNNAGYDAGNIDGQWDDQAQSALRNYQQAQALEPTGNINLRSVSALGVSFQQGGGQQGGDQQLAQEQSVAAQGGCVAAGQQQTAQGQQQGGGQQGGGGGQQGGQAQQQTAQGQQQGGGQGGTQLYLSPATVRQIEQALNAAGYDAGNVDGQWDDQAQSALTNYQQAQTLEPTGNLNTRVVAALGVGQSLQSLSGGGGGQQAVGGQGGQTQQQQGGGQTITNEAAGGQQSVGGQQADESDPNVTIITPEGEATQQ